MDIIDLLSVGFVAGLISALIATLATIAAKWLYDRVRVYKVKVGPVEVTIEPDSIDETWRKIEEKVRDLRQHPIVFISYAYTDREFAHRLAQDLRSEGIKVWLPDEQIQVGDSITDRVGEAISTSQWIIFVFSENSLRSEFVRKELELALKAEEIRARTLVLPILYQTVPLPPELGDKVFADFRENYDTGFSQLLSSIRRTHRELHQTGHRHNGK